ncbi:hypothetical protein ACFIN9_00065 [Streptomyces noursei]|uniref:hypothetical protein n=1 Tax=Streptomyces noursei TaxID=1971 RepID=UPI0036D39ED6
MSFLKKAKEHLDAFGLAERRMTKTLIGNYRFTKRCSASPGTATGETQILVRSLRLSTTLTLSGVPAATLGDEIGRCVSGGGK